MNTIFKKGFSGLLGFVSQESNVMNFNEQKRIKELEKANKKLVQEISLIRNENEYLKIENEKLNILVNSDELTKLFNKRKMNEYNLDHDFFVVIDLGKFKSLNDTFGHDVGDQALVEVANFLKREFEEFEVIRFGGDEFIIPVPSKKVTPNLLQRINYILNTNKIINFKFKKDGSFNTESLILNFGSGFGFSNADDNMYKNKRKCSYRERGYVYGEISKENNSLKAN